MRPVSEITDPAKLLEFAKGRRLLQYSSLDSLAEVTALLYNVVVLGDKNMPIKAYLDVIRQMQAVARQTELLKGLSLIESAAAGSTELDAPQRQTVLDAINRAREVVTDVGRAYQDKVDAAKSVLHAHDVIRPAFEEVVLGLRPLAFEDEFMLAVAFLDLEVSKLGAVTYLKGESADYKETKRSRALLDTRDETVLKTLSAGLSRPNAERGSVEMGMIDSSQKRLANLIDLHAAMPEVVRLLNEGKTKRDVLNEVSVGFFKEKMTLTDYDIICRMARREKLLSLRNRVKDPKNKYELRADLHEKVCEHAQRLGISERRALNGILSDFFDFVQRQALYGETPPHGKAGAKVKAKEKAEAKEAS